MKVLFLYTELAGYFLSCLEELSKKYEVHVIHWPVNPEAPFVFNLPKSINFYNRDDFSDKQLIAYIYSIQPDAIITSGWIDKSYLRAVRKYKKKIPKIITLDNHWNGSFKQRLATLLSPFTIKKTFSNAWVPGIPQVEYAKRLGFSKQKIITGFYSADYTYYNQLYKETENKKVSFPKKFIYVGRYVESKGIKDLWDSFIETQQDVENDWELWCIGTGELIKEAPKHPKIKHLGFIQPKDIHQFIRKSGVFVLPSHFEPWGVVVHEFALAGFPLICSHAVGASTAFLQNEVNGYSYPSGNKEQLKVALKKIIASTSEELIKMGDYSHQLGQSITPEIWVKNLESILV